MVDALGQRNYRTYEKEGETRVLIHGVPIQTLDRFKAACAKQHLTMKKVLVEFMNKYAQIHLPKP